MMELVNIQKKYDEHVISSDFSFRFEAGKIYALIGQSGSSSSPPTVRRYGIDATRSFRFRDGPMIVITESD